jgi:hypothetical protein
MNAGQGARRAEAGFGFTRVRQIEGCDETLTG